MRALEFNMCDNTGIQTLLDDEEGDANKAEQTHEIVVTTPIVDGRFQFR